MSNHNPSEPSWDDTRQTLKTHCPDVLEIWENPKYVAPSGRENLYPSWNKISAAEAVLSVTAPKILTGLHTGEPRSMDSRQGSMLLLWKLQCLQHGPTIYLEPELGRALLETETPGDIPCKELHWAFDAMRLILPCGLLKNPQGEDILQIKGGILRKGDAIRCPERYRGSSAWSPHTNNMLHSLLVWEVTGDNPDVVTLHGQEPWTDHTLKEFQRTLLPTDGNLEPSEIVTNNAAARIFLNTVLLLQAKPEYLSGETTRRKAKPGRGVTELKEGRTLGSFLKPRKRAAGTGEETGEGRAPQARRGHWKMQPHGPKHSLRKLLWIHPYLTGRES